MSKDLRWKWQIPNHILLHVIDVKHVCVHSQLVFLEGWITEYLLPFSSNHGRHAIEWHYIKESFNKIDEKEVLVDPWKLDVTNLYSEYVSLHVWDKN